MHYTPEYLYLANSETEAGLEAWIREHWDVESTQRAIRNSVSVLFEQNEPTMVLRVLERLYPRATLSIDTASATVTMQSSLADIFQDEGLRPVAVSLLRQYSAHNENHLFSLLEDSDWTRHAERLRGQRRFQNRSSRQKKRLAFPWCAELLLDLLVKDMITNMRDALDLHDIHSPVLSHPSPRRLLEDRANRLFTPGSSCECTGEHCLIHSGNRVFGEYENLVIAQTREQTHLLFFDITTSGDLRSKKNKAFALQRLIRPSARPYVNVLPINVSEDDGLETGDGVILPLRTQVRKLLGFQRTHTGK